MENFNKGKRFGGGGGNKKFGGKNFGGDRGGSNSGMHKAVCNECGSNCEVPFRPTGDKPIFCSNCFRDKRSDSPDRGNKRFGNDRGGNKSFGAGRDRDNGTVHKAVCSDCGSNCEVPFRPTGDKPIFCSDCFRDKRSDGPERGNKRFSNDRGGNKNFGDKRSNNGGKDTTNYKLQFEILNTKMDKILNALNLPTKTREAAPLKIDEIKTTPKNKVVATTPNKESKNSPDGLPMGNSKTL